MATALPTAYPLAPVTVSGTAITLDTMLSEPTRIRRYLSDLTLKRLFAHRVFSLGGPVTGGALLYDQLTANDLFSTRDVLNVEPGAEFPIVTSERAQPKVAKVEKLGGKFFVTDEARDRNDLEAMKIEAIKLANKLQIKLDTKAVAVLDAAVTEYSLTATGVNWSSVVTGGASQTSAAGWPAADFGKSQLAADVKELGVVYNLWLVNPAQANAFKLAYGSNAEAVLNDWGITLFSTNQVTAGTAYAVEAGMVGQMRFEKGVSVESWREEATQRTWVQVDARPVFAVTNPYSVLKITGLAG